MINGQGLRQGDPHSPLLFVLVMEALHHLFRAAERQGMISPLATERPLHRLSLFADDVMLFLKPSVHDVQACSAILEDFSHATGLRINRAKCVAMPIRCGEEDVQMLCAGLGCPMGSLPFRYLGIPLSYHKLIPEQFQELLDGMARKLPAWRAATMDKSGRLTLVQSVLAAMSIHTLMALDVPPQILAAIDKICRSFLWAGKAEAM